MNSTTQTIVMRRVRIIHMLRALFGSVGASFVLLVTSLYFIGREVWVARVVQNMPSLTHVDAFARFFVSAFTNTSNSVQALILLTAIAGLWLAREITRIVITPPLRFA